jgi:hypothetical protein
MATRVYTCVHVFDVSSESGGEVANARYAYACVTGHASEISPPTSSFLRQHRPRRAYMF